MSDTKTPRPDRGERGVLGLSLLDGLDNSKNKPLQRDLQAAQQCRVVTAARETHVAEIWALCGELQSHAEIACMYASISGERGLLFAADCIVAIAARIGDEALQLRQALPR